MKSRHIYMPARFSRCAGEAFRTPEWSNPFHGPSRKRHPGRVLFLVFVALALAFISGRL